MTGEDPSDRRGGHPHSSSAPQSSPAPLGSCRLGCPVSPPPRPRCLCIQWVEGHGLRLSWTPPERSSPPGGFWFGPAQVPGAGVSVVSATGEGALAAELSGPRHGLVAARGPAARGGRGGCVLSLWTARALEMGALPSLMAIDRGCFLTHHAPEPSVCVHARVYVAVRARVPACGAGMGVGEGRQWSPPPPPPQAPQPRASPTLGARGGAGFQKLSGTNETGGWEGVGRLSVPGEVLW